MLYVNRSLYFDLCKNDEKWAIFERFLVTKRYQSYDDTPGLVDINDLNDTPGLVDNKKKEKTERGEAEKLDIY